MPCESRYQAPSPNGTQAAVHCKDHSLYLVSIPGGAQREVVPAERRPSAYVFSPDGRWLAAGFPDGTVELMATQDNAPAKHWKADSHRIDGLYFFPNSEMLLVAPVDSRGQVWELAGTPTLRASLPVDFGGLVAYAVSPDGKLLVAAGDDTVVRWYDTATWQKTQEYSGFLLETFALAFTPDGKQVLAGGADSRITALDAATAKQLRQLPTEPGAYIADIQMLGDGQRAATLYLDDAGEKPPHAVIWNLATAHSAALKFDSPPSCAGVVGGKFWSCTTDGKTLTIVEE
jgi:WD40 repeat protein